MILAKTPMSIDISSKVSSIGLDIDAHEIRAVQMQQKSGEVVPLQAAIFPRQSVDVAKSEIDGDELSWLHEMLFRRGFMGNSVTLALPDSVCRVHALELPPVSSDAPREQIARAEIARERSCSPESFELGIWELPHQGPARNESRAISCSSKIITDSINHYKDSGLDLIAVDVEEQAIQRAVGLSKELDEDQIQSIIRVGWDSSIAVFMLEGKVIYARKIQHGVSRVWSDAVDRFALSTRAAQRVLDHSCCSDIEGSMSRIARNCWSKLSQSLVEELDVALGYVTQVYRSAPMGGTFFLGYGYGNKLIETHVDALVGTAVSFVCPKELIEVVGNREDSFSQANRLGVAWSLAMRFDR